MQTSKDKAIAQADPSATAQDRGSASKARKARVILGLLGQNNLQQEPHGFFRELQSLAGADPSSTSEDFTGLLVSLTNTLTKKLNSAEASHADNTALAARSELDRQPANLIDTKLSHSSNRNSQMAQQFQIECKGSDMAQQHPAVIFKNMVISDVNQMQGRLRQLPGPTVRLVQLLLKEHQTS